mgnify:CR=1 FL=1
MSKTELFSKFFMEFLDDLSVIRPNDSSLLWVKTAVSILDAKTLTEQFMEYVGPYKKRILAKDETFFIDELHKEIEKESFAGREISKVRTIWLDPSTTDETKTHIWKYFILLVKIGEDILRS